MGRFLKQNMATLREDPAKSQTFSGLHAKLKGAKGIRLT